MSAPAPAFDEDAPIPPPRPESVPAPPRPWSRATVLGSALVVLFLGGAAFLLFAAPRSFKHYRGSVLAAQLQARLADQGVTDVTCADSSKVGAGVVVHCTLIINKRLTGLDLTFRGDDTFTAAEVAP